MTTADLIETTRDALAVAPAWLPGLGVVLALLLLFLAARRLRRWGRDRAASALRWLSTGLGLAWSAQGMYDVATDPDHYHLPGKLAIVLCVIFEVYLLTRMLTAERYRLDLKRRPRHVQAVWVAGAVMALVVSLGEGWAQAPARLAVPLLVVYGWYMDLTADDDPASRAETEWNWTLRSLLLRVGAKKYRQADRRTQTEAEREAMRDRLSRLGLAIDIGQGWSTALLRRKARLARLVALADPATVAEARIRVARSTEAYRGGLHAAPADPPKASPTKVPEPPAVSPRPLPPLLAREPARPLAPEVRSTGSRIRRSDGAVVMDYRADAVRLHRLSQAEGVNGGKGLTAEALAMCYDPPMGTKYAQLDAAEARRLGPLVPSAPINGHDLRSPVA